MASRLSCLVVFALVMLTASCTDDLGQNSVEETTSETTALTAEPATAVVTSTTVVTSTSTVEQILPIDGYGHLAVGETRSRTVSAHCGLDLLLWKIDGSQWEAVSPIGANSSKDLPKGWSVDNEDELIELHFERTSEDVIVATPPGIDAPFDYRRSDIDNGFCM